MISRVLDSAYRKGNLKGDRVKAIYPGRVQGQIIEETDAGLLNNPQLVEQIYRKTEGNPLFFMESLRLFARQEDGAAFTDRMTNVIQSRC